MPRATQTVAAVQYLRRAAWHLKAGGVQQLRAFRTREATAQGVDARPFVSNKSPLKKLFSLSNAPSMSLDFPELDFTAIPDAPFGDFRVAVILDDFSMMAWSYEFSTVAITPQAWRNEIKNIDLLFVESAWSGNGGAWKHKITGSKAPSQEIQEVAEYCRSTGIPTVFWNKEDPPHFEDFIETAKLFDVVFTSDSNKVPEYCRRLGHNQIDTLAFAAQPVIHNPIRPPHGFHERDVAFAGMYFAHKYPERRKQMDLLLGAAYKVSSTMKYGLEIFSRFLGEDTNYQFPAPLSQRVVGSLSYNKMLTAYKAYKVFLNVNSVVDSPSMCARRVFEITASGTPVISTPSEAIPHYFTEAEVPLVSSEREAENAISALVHSPELNDRTVHLAQRAIWKSHTYTHRASQILNACGFEPRTSLIDLPSTTIMVSTNRPYQVNSVLETAAAQTGVETQLNLLLHGFECNESELRAYANDLGLNLNLLSAPNTATLGECLNQLVNSAEGTVLTKMDDDDFYGENYLQDLLYALRFSGAGIVGKQAHYMHLSASEATILRSPEREHRWTNFVMGPTITASKEIFIETPFESKNRGEDTNFLSRSIEAGMKIYSADRFNFLQMRSGNHTWNISDSELLNRGEVQFFGKGLSHMMF